MKTFRLIAISFLITTFFAVSAFAQTQPPTKVALVNTNAFYQEKVGITKIENAYKKLNAEFKVEFDAIQNNLQRLQNLQKELQALQTRANDPNNKVPIDKNQVQTKVDEFERLQTETKRKQEDAKKRYEKREAELIAPIVQDVGSAIGAFAKQKGFTLVMDTGKLVETRILLFNQEATDITKEFITYYNARPAGTAATKP